MTVPEIIICARGIHRDQKQTWQDINKTISLLHFQLTIICYSKAALYWKCWKAYICHVKSIQTVTSAALAYHHKYMITGGRCCHQLKLSLQTSLNTPLWWPHPINWVLQPPPLKHTVDVFKIVISLRILR